MNESTPLPTATLTLEPIGYIATPFKDRYDAPRQPGRDEGGVGIITLLPDRNFEQALEDLDGFEKIWLIFWFDRNANWKPKVLAPRGERVKRGVFATRSPHRPNPIGLSLVDLIEVQGRTLRVGGVDLLDNTPILDIKPYLPYAEAFPSAASGWLEDVLDGGSVFEIHWSSLALAQLRWLKDTFAIDLQGHAERILSLDPEPHPYRRIENEKSGIRTLAIRSWRIRFEVRETRVDIIEIASGYDRKMLMKSEIQNLHDGAAHQAFHAIWPSNS